MSTTKTTSGGRDNSFSKTYTDAADWNDSLCGVKHKVTLTQEGNKIRIKLDAWKDYPSSDIIGNLRRGKWDKDNSASVPHSLKLWIKDVNTGEYFVGNQLGEGVEVLLEMVIYMSGQQNILLHMKLNGWRIALVFVEVWGM